MNGVLVVPSHSGGGVPPMALYSIDFFFFFIFFYFETDMTLIMRL